VTEAFGAQRGALGDAVSAQVVGGEYFDPAAPPAKSKALRKASERPPGL
jgi:hypothetical protein